VRLTLQAAAVLVLLSMVGLFARSLAQNQTTVYALVKDGQSPQAPNFSLPDLRGHGHDSLAAYRGRIVLVNFWASWCDACQEEAPLFNQVIAQYGKRGVTVVGVDTGDFASDGRAFARTYHEHYPLVHDPGSVSQRWGTGTGLPVTYVVNRRGKVVHLFDGVVTSNSLNAVLRPMLQGRA
jgi:cytochrome c biogenesis protein CcmG, thiol:disulfide interchange protein DsbE